MNKRIVLYALLPVLGLGVLGGGVAMAQGLFQNASPDEMAAAQESMFESKATILGISIDQFKNAWAQGKSIRDIAQEQGISETDLQVRMQEARKQRTQTFLSTLVDKGVLTQAQADARLQYMETNSNNREKSGKGFRGMFR